MAEKELNIKDIIDKTKNFDQPYAAPIPECICEVEIQSFERKPSKDNGYDMLTITVADTQDRTARTKAMLELQWIEGTLRLIKGLYTKNAAEADKESAKDKINKYFDQAKNEDELKTKCVDALTKLVEKGCVAWLRVEFKDPKDKYPDKALYSYEPSWRWKTVSEAADALLESGEPVDPENGEPTDKPSDNLFDN